MRRKLFRCLVSSKILPCLCMCFHDKNKYIYIHTHHHNQKAQSSLQNKEGGMSEWG